MKSIFWNISLALNFLLLGYLIIDLCFFRFRSQSLVDVPHVSVVSNGCDEYVMVEFHPSNSGVHSGIFTAEYPEGTNSIILREYAMIFHPTSPEVFTTTRILLQKKTGKYNVYANDACIGQLNVTPEKIHWFPLVPSFKTKT